MAFRVAIPICASSICVTLSVQTITITSTHSGMITCEFVPIPCKHRIFILQGSQILAPEYSKSNMWIVTCEIGS